MISDDVLDSGALPMGIMNKAKIVVLFAFMVTASTGMVPTYGILLTCEFRFSFHDGVTRQGPHRRRLN
jgi:hypothetical protein